MRLLFWLPWLLGVHLSAEAIYQDVVVLANGDRLTGAIQRLNNGTLLLEHELLDAIRVEWTDVRSLESAKTFSVLTASGEHVIGRIQRQGAETKIEGTGADAAAFASDRIVRLAPERERPGTWKLLRALDGSTDLGYSMARGNQNQTQFSLGGRAEYRSAKYEFVGRLDSLFARQDDARSQSRHALNLRLDRYLNGRVFTYGLSGFERNERRKLDLRTRLGGGMGWRLFDRAETTLSALAGCAFVHERLRGLDNRASGEGFAGLEWATTLLKIVEVSTHVTMHPDLLGSGRVRLEYDSMFRIPIAGPFTYSLRIYDRFDNRPASAVKSNDYGIVSGLGVSF